MKERMSWIYTARPKVECATTKTLLEVNLRTDRTILKTCRKVNLLQNHSPWFNTCK